MNFLTGRKRTMKFLNQHPWCHNCRLSGGSLRAGHRANWPAVNETYIVAINLPGCFRLIFLLSFIRKTENAQLKNPTDLLHKNLMKSLLYSFNGIKCTVLLTSACWTLDQGSWIAQPQSPHQWLLCSLCQTNCDSIYKGKGKQLLSALQTTTDGQDWSDAKLQISIRH